MPDTLPVSVPPYETAYEPITIARQAVCDCADWDAVRYLIDQRALQSSAYLLRRLQAAPSTWRFAPHA